MCDVDQQMGKDDIQIGLGMFWWDGKGKGYRTMFCEDGDPSGCSVYNGLGNWEGSDWVFNHEYEENKKKVKIKQVLTATSPSSFIARFYRSIAVLRTRPADLHSTPRGPLSPRHHFGGLY
jgi:hypothetical protein